MIGLLITVLVVVLVYKIFVFLISLIYRRNDIADVSWGISILIVALIALIYTDNYMGKNILAVTLVFIWAMRISIRIFLRNWNKKEDFRYLKIRNGTRNFFLLRSFIQVYFLQGILAVIVALPITMIAYYGGGLDTFSLIGLAVWVVGFFFEAVGDYQLDIFKRDKNNKGKILTEGLWKYSRHPNYFGEIMMWWGIFLMCLTLPWVWISILGPITITLLITQVSGIPMLEKSKIGNAEFEAYKKKTSVLIPLPPRL